MNDLSHYNLTSTFPSWRHGQKELTEAVIESEKRFIILDLPPGVGKSIICVMASLNHDKPTVILTGTKGLQDQYSRDFKGHCFDMRGMGNYLCRHLLDLHGVEWPINSLYPLTTKEDCAQGPCHDGYKCQYAPAPSGLRQGHGCVYFNQYEEACSHKMVMTNYAYWLAINFFGKSLGARSLMVCDEAHTIRNWMLNFMSISLTPWQLQRWGSVVDPPYGMGPRLWAQWANDTLHYIHDEDPNTKNSEKKDMSGKLRLLSMADEDWYLNDTDLPEHISLTAGPLNPAAYTEQLLFRGAQKVILSSATINHELIEQLGVDLEDVEWLGAPSPFQVSRRPIYRVHTDGARLNYKTHEGIWKIILAKIDRIIVARRELGWKGIIQSVSYEKAQWVMKNSDHVDLMVFNDPKSPTQDIINVVDLFGKSNEPTILVSPSVVTGFDFPHDKCRYQIQLKVPFPQSLDPYYKAQADARKGLGLFLAAQSLCQAYGRGMRAEDDYCEFFIMDNNLQWMLSNNTELFSQWFVEAVQTVCELPEPLEI